MSNPLCGTMIFSLIAFCLSKALVQLLTASTSPSGKEDMYFETSPFKSLFFKESCNSIIVSKAVITFSKSFTLIVLLWIRANILSKSGNFENVISSCSLNVISCNKESTLSSLLSISFLRNNGCINHFFIILLPIGVIALLNNLNKVPLSEPSNELENISKFCKVIPSKTMECCDFTKSYSLIFFIEIKFLSSFNHFK
ncbi:hypothetical protein AWRI1631_43170 [Saccharomyces cerevisiae AWRI1631]|uniref:Uncharacterized protein n=1 Tax=Saccharomyces cerevisiae (strain AWRI1631) TaxID=545124 RepID=B5VFZ5_YEAS6|nr:hypothetical protein AWRI1631_43170 [Saccharomyces cerevisiae AWRI1631]